MKPNIDIYRVSQWMLIKICAGSQFVLKQYKRFVIASYNALSKRAVTVCLYSVLVEELNARSRIYVRSRIAVCDVFTMHTIGQNKAPNLKLA